MHISEAFQIANQRRAAKGLPLMTAISTKDSPEYREVFKIINEKRYELIHKIINAPHPQAEERAKVCEAMAGKFCLEPCA
jgi:alpha-ketoglutarate-dependent taurine dioxygenase